MTPRRAEVAIVYLAGLAQGLSLVTFPALSALFASPRAYHLSNSEYGGLFVPLVVLAIAGSSLGARASRRRGLKPVFVTGLGFNLGSMSLLAISERFIGRHDAGYALLLAATAALGAGFGTTLMALNTYVAEFFPEKSGVALPALHAFLGTGTALAPILVAVMSGASRWQLMPLVLAVGFLILGVASLSQPPAAVPPGTPRSGAPFPAARSAISPRLAVYAGAVFLYGICETIFGNWATIYLGGEARIPLVWAELSLTAFWAMVTTGRIVVAVISLWVDTRITYAVLPVLIVLALLNIPRAAGAAGAAVFAFGFAGVACSAFFPLSISLAEKEFSPASAAVSGGLVAMYMLGYGVAAFGVGPLRDLAHVPLSHIYAGTSWIAAVMAAAALSLVVSRRS